MTTPRRSEVHAYLHIVDELKKKNWEQENIYTQQECLSIPEIKKHLILNKPENIVDLGRNLYYVIEAKNERNKLGIALKEAEEDYADKINQSKSVKCLFL